MYRSRGETAVVECYPRDNKVVKHFVPRKKKFGPGHGPLRGSLEMCFAREVECLQRLKGEKHFPQLIDHDIKNLTIEMSYVGRPFRHFADDNRQKYIEQVDPIVDTLTKHKIRLAYELNPNDGKTGYMLSMMMVHLDQLNIIDFERAWPIGFEQEGSINEALISSFDHHDDAKFKSLMRETIITTNKEEAPKGQYEKE